MHSSERFGLVVILFGVALAVVLFLLGAPMMPKRAPTRNDPDPTSPEFLLNPAHPLSPLNPSSPWH